MASLKRQYVFQAYARKGAALSMMGRHEDSLMAYLEAFGLEPDNEDFKQLAKAERKKLFGKSAMNGTQFGIRNIFHSLPRQH